MHSPFWLRFRQLIAELALPQIVPLDLVAVYLVPQLEALSTRAYRALESVVCRYVMPACVSPRLRDIIADFTFPQIVLLLQVNPVRVNCRELLIAHFAIPNRLGSFLVFLGLTFGEIEDLAASVRGPQMLVQRCLCLEYLVAAWALECLRFDFDPIIAIRNLGRKIRYHLHLARQTDRISPELKARWRNRWACRSEKPGVGLRGREGRTLKGYRHPAGAGT